MTDPHLAAIVAVSAATLAILAGIAGESSLFAVAGLVAAAAMALAWATRGRR